MTYREKGGANITFNLRKRRKVGQRNVITKGVAAGYICGGFPEADLSGKAAEDKGGRTVADPTPANISRRQAPLTTTQPHTQSNKSGVTFFPGCRGLVTCLFEGV